MVNFQRDSGEEFGLSTRDKNCLGTSGKIVGKGLCSLSCYVRPEEVSTGTFSFFSYE